MARFAGRFGRVYLAPASDGEASPIANVSKWGLSATTDKIEVTALGDQGKVYVSGLPDASGTFEGFMDNASAALYAAAQDGLARKFYLYPDTSLDTSYWFGTVLPDFSANGDVAGAGAFSSSWSAASPILRVDA